MTNTIKELIARKSVRAFTDRKITDGEKLMILTAAANAPTAGNQQLYTVIDVTDQKIKDALVDTCDGQPFIAKAPLVLIFCADCKKWYDAYLSVGCEARMPDVGDLMLAVSDANIAAQNAVTAAESLGIGSCYIGDIMENCERQRELLGLPKYVFPAAMLVFGFPTEQQKERTKPERAALSHIVRENRYREMNAEELRDMLSPRCGQKGYEAWIRAFCERKYNSDFSVEMSRSCKKYIDDFAKK